MANLLAIHSVGASLITFLRNSYPEPLRTRHPCDFRLLSSGELNEADNMETSLTLFLYRVNVDEHLRNASRRHDPVNGKMPLAVDLNYLMTVWANSALAEHSILAWAMRQFHFRPMLDISSLSPEGGWNSGDAVQLIPSELSTAEIMSIWDSMSPPYRLSVAYMVRVVQIDSDQLADERRVVATRHTWTERGAQP
jgi:hypothetical protein